MAEIEFTEGQPPYRIDAKLNYCGRDLVVMIGGGTVPHIGAVALGVSRFSLADSAKISATASVLCRTGHKEDLLARHAALSIAGRLNINVVVMVGIHVDKAKAEEITTMERNFNELLKKILRYLGIEENV